MTKIVTMADPESGSAVGRAVVSGATGFIGRRLVTTLRRQGAQVTVLVRDPGKAKALWTDGQVRKYRVDFSVESDIGAVCKGVNTVFHLAGYAHAGDANDDTASALHRTVTVKGTRALLSEAVRAGVQRFVFVSSVKAMGEGSDRCLDETSPVAPTTAYGRAKREAEELVLEAGAKHGIHVAVLRLPLVYGSGGNGNLPRMIEAIDRGRFPPLPDVRNKRSMVHVDDVVQALRLAVENPKAKGEVYLVTDGRFYSTYQICAFIRRALGRAEPKWSVPIGGLRAAARIGDLISGARGRPFFFDSITLNKIIGSAWYSSEKIAHDLGFRPTHTLETALPEMVEEYRRRLG